MPSLNNRVNQPDGPFESDYYHLAALLEHGATDRPERGEMRSGYVFDGCQTLLYFITGRDRSTLIAQVTELINQHDKDKLININSPVVFPLDGYVGVLFYLTRRSNDFATNRDQLLKLADVLSVFTTKPVEGKQVFPLEVYKMAVEVPDRPGVLHQIAKQVADAGGNIKRLDPYTWDRNPFGPSDPWCLLTFTLEFSNPARGTRDDLKRANSAIAPGARVYFDREADEAQMRALGAQMEYDRARHGRAA